MVIHDQSSFQHNLGDALEGMSHFFRCCSGVRNSDTEPTYFHDILNPLDDQEGFFQTWCDITGALFSMPVPFTFGLNGNPDLLARMIPRVPFRLTYASEEGECLHEMYREIVEPLLEACGNGNPGTVNLVAVISAPLKDLGMVLFDEALDLFEGGVSVDEALAAIAAEVTEGNDAQASVYAFPKKSLVGFVEDNSLGACLRLSVWAIAPAIGVVRGGKEGS